MCVCYCYAPFCKRIQLYCLACCCFTLFSSPKKTKLVFLRAIWRGVVVSSRRFFSRFLFFEHKRVPCFCSNVEATASGARRYTYENSMVGKKLKLCKSESSFHFCFYFLLPLVHNFEFLSSTLLVFRCVLVCGVNFGEGGEVDECHPSWAVPIAPCN